MSNVRRLKQGTGNMEGRDSTTVLATMDETSQRPIPTVWRPVFKEIVHALVEHDYGLSLGVPRVEAVSLTTAAHIRKYVQGYGQTLLELPEETWESSVCMWMGGYWDALIDLWTQAEGRSDLVLNARITEAEAGFSFKIQMVYVP